MAALAEDAPAEGAGRWLILFGVWLVYFSFGMITASIAPLVAPIRADFGVGNAVMGAILGSWPVTYILAAIPCGMLLDRLGARRMLAIACVIMAASVLARGMAQTPWQLFFAVALFGAGGPMISVGAPMVIARLFQGKTRATAMGLYVTGPYMGGLVSLAVTNSLLMPLAGGDWRGVMTIHAGLVLLSGVIWLTVSMRRIAGAGLAVGDGAKKYNPGAFADILAVGRIRLILLISVGIFFINHGFNNWMPEILRARGFSAVEAGYWAAIPPAVGILGVLIIPRLAAGARGVLVLAGLIAAVFLASLLLQTQAGAPLATGLILQGLARGSMMTVAIMLLMDTPGVPPERLGLAGGMFFAAAEIGGVLGPVTFGVLAAATGGFVAPLAAVSVLCLGLFALLARLRRG